MKIKREEFKSLLKEVLEEMFQEGSLNEMFVKMAPQQGMMHATQQTQNHQQYVDPKIRALAAQAAKNPNEAMMLERLLADTAATTYQAQAYSDPDSAMSDAPVPHYGYQPPQYGYPQQHMQLPPVQPLFPQQPQYGAPQQQPTNNGGYATNWARLAFNSPIRNRPSSENSAMMGFGGAGASSGFLPGIGSGR